MKQLLERFFSSPAYAVVGVSESREKYGNIVYRYLRDKGFPVYPVNPNLTEVEGDKCYASVRELPDDVKSVVLVVPPNVTERAVRDCNAKGVSAVWMQPGAESFQAIAYANASSIAVIHDACVMVMLAGVTEFRDIENWLTRSFEAFST